MKHLEGKDVFLRPTGNNARNSNSKYIKGKIIKVAKVFITFTVENSSHEKYRFNGHNLRNECNGGYVIYESKQDIEDYFLSSKLSKEISEKYRTQGDYQKVELETLKQVAELLGVSLEQ